MSPDETPQHIVARVLQAFEKPDPLTCAVVEPEIPELVAAEAAGADVESDPQFADLLRHLDQCEACMAMYVGVAEDYATLVGEGDTLPVVSVTPPSFFRETRRSEFAIIRWLNTTVRQLIADLQMPNLVPSIATLSEQRTTLFSGQTDDVPDSPYLSVSVSGTNENATVQVMVATTGSHRSWQVILSAGAQTHSVRTDASGVARFGGIVLLSAQPFTIQLLELRAEVQDG